MLAISPILKMRTGARDVACSEIRPFVATFRFKSVVNGLQSQILGTDREKKRHIACAGEEQGNFNEPKRMGNEIVILNLEALESISFAFSQWLESCKRTWRSREGNGRWADGQMVVFTEKRSSTLWCLYRTPLERKMANTARAVLSTVAFCQDRGQRTWVGARLSQLSVFCRCSL